MKIFLVFLAFVTLLSASFASMGTAQETPYDPGEQNLLSSACAQVWNVAINEGLTPVYCRRNAQEEVEGYKAKVSVHLKVREYSTAYDIDVTLYKSPWIFQGLVING